MSGLIHLAVVFARGPRPSWINAWAQLPPSLFLRSK